MNTLHVAFLAAGAALGCRNSYGQLAVGIVADAPREIQWAEERLLWGRAIDHAAITARNSGTIAQNTDKLLQSTNELLARLGKTSTAVSDAKPVIPRSTDSLVAAVKLDSRKHTLATSSQHYSPGQFPLSDANNPRCDVASTYEVFGQEKKRDNARYTAYGAQLAMDDRVQTAAQNAEKVEMEELEIQAKAVDRLKAATTEAEIAVCTVAVEASKGRLDLAHAKLNQARDEMDEYRTRIAIEQERKAEADREWTQAVVTGLRTRALDAYKAQVGATDEKSGS